MADIILQQGLNFQTPEFAALYMKSLIPAGVLTVLEPTPGQGNICKHLYPDYQVTAPDDFFTLPAARFDCVIMNPPFSAKYTIMDNAPAEVVNKKGMRIGYYILQQCMEMSDVVIALMPWFTLIDSDVRMRSLKSWGMVSVTAMPRKTFKYCRIQTAVIVLQKGYTGNTDFIVYDLLKF